MLLMYPLIKHCWGGGALGAIIQVFDCMKVLSELYFTDIDLQSCIVVRHRTNPDEVMSTAILRMHYLQCFNQGHMETGSVEG